MQSLCKFLEAGYFLSFINNRYPQGSSRSSMALQNSEPMIFTTASQ